MRNATGHVSEPDMLDCTNLKSQRLVLGGRVPCPVKGCSRSFPRMTQRGPNLNSSKDLLQDFLCEEHGIYVSPTTFEYQDRYRNIIWKSPEDIEHVHLLENSASGKRTWSRMGRQNDEDSLTWNTFHYLSKRGLIGGLFTKLTGIPSSEPTDALFWSVELARKCTPTYIKEARKHLGENQDKGSEPDLVFLSKDCVTVVEIKLNAPTITRKSKVPAGYQDYLDRLGESPLCVRFKEVVSKIGYELSRFLLLGHELARVLNRKHSRLILITRSRASVGLTDTVASILQEPCKDSFRHTSWDDVFDYLKDRSDTSVHDHSKIEYYLANKSRGYSSRGTLQRVIHS